VGKKRRRAGALALGIVGACVVACGTSTSPPSGGGGGGDGGAGSCNVDGKTYADGQSVPSTDTCNTCSCNAGAVSCTEKACPPGADGGGGEGGAGCDYDGKRYAVGESFPSTDGCNTCQCSATGSVGCTKKACAPDAGKDAGYTCPPAGTIDCQPIVPPEDAPKCSGPYHDWIKKNCPDVKFVF
jgi:pacifastin inhibitor LCMII/VWC domain-containing protein